MRGQGKGSTCAQAGLSRCLGLGPGMLPPPTSFPPRARFPCKVMEEEELLREAFRLRDREFK